MLRLTLRSIGNLLIGASLFGVAVLLYAAFGPETPPPWVTDTPLNAIANPSLAAAPASVPLTTAAAAQRGDSPTALPITHLSVERIGLEADVVPARLVERSGGTTWEVPAFKVGHAESTAGAGQPGNAVLLGHVTSLHSGNVFQDLDQVRVADTVHVFADQTEFDYRVVSVAHIARDDTRVLEQGATPAVSLITCTGVWLPTIWDYTERLVVRAELAARP